MSRRGTNERLATRNAPNGLNRATVCGTPDGRMSFDPARLPRHVAIIMDGNGRWAQRRSLPRVDGHRRGAKSVKEVVRAAREVGLRAITLYAFSSQNWDRPP